MKRMVMALVVAGVFATVSYGATFTGEVMDSSCAKTGAHNPKMGTAKACTEACVKAGSTYVLYNPSTKRTYQLDDQSKLASFAGERVTVTGDYDRTTKTIHVSDVKSAS